MKTNGPTKQNIPKITESPRDAQQGLPYVIPVEKRAEYINALMKVGFDVIDFGSFVSPKAVPQMADPDKVLELVDKQGSSTRLMAIVGNLRGAAEAAAQSKVDIIGFPYSLSDTFLKKNINAERATVFNLVRDIQHVSVDSGKELRIFMSMAFGNPYNDPWNEDVLAGCIDRLVHHGIKTITLSDTIGLAREQMITRLFQRFVPLYPEIEFGLHLHTPPGNWIGKIDAAWNAGCRSFDGVVNGIGGCPMTGYDLIGNLNTLNLLEYFTQKGLSHSINESLLVETAGHFQTFA